MPSPKLQKILRYPSRVKNTSDPYVIFSSHKAHYNTSVRKIDMASDDHIALYMPSSIAVSDTMRYENAATGMIGALVENHAFDSYSKEDLIAWATKDHAAMATAAGTVAGKVLGNTVGGAIVGALSSGLVGDIINESQKNTQVTINPREFALFKAPGMRQFAYNFTFIPEDRKESDDVMDIIKSFREAMYPTDASTMTYKFPHVYTIQYVNSDIIKIPEVALASANVVYNPNSMSYFIEKGRPVEIQLSLTFQELKPITSKLVSEGY